MNVDIERLESTDFPSAYGARAGILLTDWAGDALRVSDGGDGSVYAELGHFDVSINPDGVEALRDYLNEVLSVRNETK